MPATEIGIGIALHECGSSACDTSGSTLGGVLYAGTYVPVYDGTFGDVPYQNFTVSVPDGYSGNAILAIVHAPMAGVSFLS